MDSSEVGKYGLLLLMKKHDPETSIASFPIDEEEVTFGRDSNCSVRLYYNTVSALHAKIIFQERKAFLIVLGTHGLSVDGCPVFPSVPSSQLPTTIPLSNGSEIEIHKKRFRFEYPPKAIRAALLATPSPTKKTRRRTLRLSMIQSAQVFTPRPSKNPRENLRVLQSPIKPLGSPLKSGYHAGEDEEEPIILVNGDNPRVVEEEKDLVILEHVEVEDPEPEPQHRPLRIRKKAPALGVPNVEARTPMRARQASGSYAPPVSQPAPVQPQPQPQPQPPPQTPRRRAPRSSLHRVALLRSAQRAAMRAEMEYEEDEEREVEESVGTLEGLGTALLEANEEEEEDDDDDDDDELGRFAGELEGSDEDQNDDEDERGEPEDDGQDQQQAASGWLKSLEVVKSAWPFRVSQSPEKEMQHEEQDITEAQIHDDDDENIKHDSDENQPPQYVHDFQETAGADTQTYLDADVDHQPSSRPPPRRVHGAFMTPQAKRMGGGLRGAGRYSIGGGSSDGPQRVRLVGPWMVRDIVVPVLEEHEPKEEDDKSMVRDLSKPASVRVSEEEKKAIQARRRSAFAMPDDFFGGQIPGSRRASAVVPPPATPVTSPTKAWVSSREIKEEEEEDTSVLLERMKEMVEGMKRRRSMREEHESRRAMLGELREEAEGRLEDEYAVEDDGGAFDQDAMDQDGATNEGRREEELIDEPEETDFGDVDEAHMDIVEGTDEDEDSTDDEHQEEGAVDITPHAGPSIPFNGESTLTFQAPPGTPQMDSLRHMFSSSQTALATPQFSGMREMYLRERAQDIGTPIYEGVGEMMSTPAAYRAHESTQESSDEAEDSQDDSSDKDAPPTPVPARATRAKRTPALKAKADPPATRKRTPAVRASTRKAETTPAGADATLMADDELTPDLPPVRGTRKASDAPKGAIVRRSRRAASEVEDEQDAVPPVKANPAGTKVTRTKATSKAAAKIAKTNEVSEDEVKASGSSKRVRRGATDPAVSTDDEPPASKTAGRSRIPKIAASTSLPSGSDVPMKIGPPKGRRAVRAKVPAATSATEASASKLRSDEPQALDMDEDPLDAFGRPESAEEVEAHPAAKVRRGRNKATAQVEPVVEEEPTANVATRSVREKRMPTTVATSSRTTTRSRAASGKKASPIPEDKENSPKDPVVKEEDDEQTVTTAAKVPRTRRTKAQSEPEKEPVPPKTRATRTRTASARK